jgi:nitrate/nitrite transporter NarK
MDHQSPGVTFLQLLGTSIGSACGLAKAGVFKVKIAVVAFTYHPGIDTAILSAIGAVVGFVVTKLLEHLYKKIFKPNDKKH